MAKESKIEWQVSEEVDDALSVADGEERDPVRDCGAAVILAKAYRHLLREKEALAGELAEKIKESAYLLSRMESERDEARRETIEKEWELSAWKSQFGGQLSHAVAARDAAQAQSTRDAQTIKELREALLLLGYIDERGYFNTNGGLVHTSQKKEIGDLLARAALTPEPGKGEAK